MQTIITPPLVKLKCLIRGNRTDMWLSSCASVHYQIHLKSVFRMSSVCPNGSSKAWAPLPDRFIGEVLLEMFPLFYQAQLQLVNVMQTPREGEVGGGKLSRTRDVWRASPSLRNIKYIRVHHFEKKNKFFFQRGSVEMFLGAALWLSGGLTSWIRLRYTRSCSFPRIWCSTVFRSKLLAGHRTGMIKSEVFPVEQLHDFMCPGGQARCPVESSKNRKCVFNQDTVSETQKLIDNVCRIRSNFWHFYCTLAIESHLFGTQYSLI